MSAIRKLFETLSFALTVYTVYTKLKQLQEMRADIYNQLPEELQAEWIEVFGKPDGKSPAVSQISSVKAGI